MSSKTFEIYYALSDYSDKVTIEKENIEEHKDFLYFRCPVWNHLFNRTFVFKSPIDFKVKLNSDTIEYEIDGKSGLVNFLEGEHERNTFQNGLFTAYIPDLSRDRPIIQANFSDIYFWTPPNLSYAWFEFGDHPMTSVNNNFTALPGWFNLANHPRNTSLGIKFVDKTKPVIIKEGDPLFRVRFYTDDLNDLPHLIKKHVSEFPDEQMGERVSMIRKDPEFLKSLLFEKNV